jgi:NhaP-type Na+/H+ or K+/H+ antiporter
LYENLAVIMIFLLCFSTIAGRLERTVVSGPMVYVGFGFLAGPLVLGLLDMDVTNIELRVIADLTLALVLFLDAANANLGVLKRFSQMPARMLLLGLPMSIALGTLAGYLIFDRLDIFEIAVLATMLAATDAALGKAVITNDQVPEKLREGLNIESGLNDGICVPILFLFIALAIGHEAAEDSTALAVKLVLKELGIGLAVGVGVTFAGAKLMRWTFDRGWVTAVWMQVPVVALAVGCFAVAQSLHGSGYVASFTGGLLFGYLAKKQTHELVHAGEGVGETLALLTWLVFGAAVVGHMGAFSPEAFLYAILSLTVVRMLPMYLALTGSGETAAAKLFLGWFGPRGLASIVFAVIVLGYELDNGELLAKTVVYTVLISVILHGLTANPLARWIGSRAQG